MKSNENGVSSQHQAKRLLYVRTIIRLLRSCGAKYVKLLLTPEGIKTFHTATILLLSDISSFTADCYGTENAETINLLSEYVNALKTKEVIVSRLLIESFDKWLKQQHSATIIIDCSFAAFRFCKPFSLNTLALLELTIGVYFQNMSETNHVASWVNVISKIGNISYSSDVELLIQNKLLLCFHICVVEKFATTINVAENSVLFQNCIKCFDMFNENDMIETKIILCWGMITYMGYRLMEHTNSSNHLLMLARYVMKFLNLFSNV